MTKRKVAPLILLLFLPCVIFIPIKDVVLLTEQKTDRPATYYLPLAEDVEFQIRYVHSIHLTDVFETYTVTDNKKIRFKSMIYENIGIGLPGSAGEGEVFSVDNGLYTLTYEDRVIDSFTMFIATIDTDLALRYEEKELDLKEKLVKGKSYEFSVAKLSIYQMMKGVNLYGERSKTK